MQLLAREMKINERDSQFFITGILSALDTLVHQEMAEVVHELPVADDVKQALLGKHNIYRQVLDFVLSHEINGECPDSHDLLHRIDKQTVNSVYREALHWAEELEY